jgi:phosphatidylglycerol:prolipoprotein diacylglycerol transferase
LIAVGFLVALWLAALQAKKEGIQPNRIMDLGFYILLAAIIGSRLFFILINAGHYINHPLDIFKIWEGGLVFYGGVLLAVPVAVWYMKRNGMELWSTADIFAPPIAIGHVFGRLGCLAAGCCHGKAAENLPWGIIFTDPECLAPTNILLHPTQLYESAGEFIIFIILMMLRNHKSFTGQLFMMYLIFYAVLRFIIEFFRGDVARGFIMSGLSVSQGISLLLLIAGITGYAVLRKRKPVI